MKNLVKVRVVALFATLCISHVYAEISGSTWKVVNIINDLNHPVKISSFDQLRGNFVLANIPRDTPENNNWDFKELARDIEIEIPKSSSLDIDNKSVTFIVKQGSKDITTEYTNGTNGPRAALVFIAQYDQYDRYGTMILDPNPDSSAISPNAVYLGYNGWTVGQQGYDFTYYLYPYRVSDVVQPSMGLGPSTPYFKRFGEVMYEGYGDENEKSPASGTIYVARDICATQATIANYLTCFHD